MAHSTRPTSINSRRHRDRTQRTGHERERDEERALGPLPGEQLTDTGKEKRQQGAGRRLGDSVAGSTVLWDGAALPPHCCCSEPVSVEAAPCRVMEPVRRLPERCHGEQQKTVSCSSAAPAAECGGNGDPPDRFVLRGRAEGKHLAAVAAKARRSAMDAPACRAQLFGQAVSRGGLVPMQEASQADFRFA
jgi:hypothetical protein